MSMQNFLKKASKKLVVDPDAAPESETDSPQQKQSANPNAKSKNQSGSGPMHGTQPVAKKGTRKKI